MRMVLSALRALFGLQGTTSSSTPSCVPRPRGGGYSAKLAAIVERVLEILHDSSSSSPVPATPSSADPLESACAASPSYPADDPQSPPTNGLSSPRMLTASKPSLSANVQVPSVASSSSSRFHGSIDSPGSPPTELLPSALTSRHLSAPSSSDEAPSRAASSVRSSCPSKILIFSEWLALLDLLQFALHRSGVEAFKYMGGSQKSESAKLRLFKTDPDTRVMLCSLQKAGRGITLTEADHVMFVEVPLNAAEEEQAIGRIYRMGQYKQTHVWR